MLRPLECNRGDFNCKDFTLLIKTVKVSLAKKANLHRIFPRKKEGSALAQGPMPPGRRDSAGTRSIDRLGGITERSGLVRSLRWGKEDEKGQFARDRMESVIFILRDE